MITDPGRYAGRIGEIAITRPTRLPGTASYSTENIMIFMRDLDI